MGGKESAQRVPCCLPVIRNNSRSYVLLVLQQSVTAVRDATRLVQWLRSDVGLAKICKKLSIPRPPRGYWTKKSYGVRTRKEHLRPATVQLSARMSCGEAGGGVAAWAWDSQRFVASCSCWIIRCA